MKGSRVLYFVFIFIFSYILFAQDNSKPDALAMYRSGSYQGAISVCLKELEDTPYNMDSYTVLCWSLVKLRAYKKALTYAKKANSIAKSDKRIVEVLGEIHYGLGNNIEALKWFEDYAAIAPNGERIDIVYYYMGEIFIKFGEYNHADIALTTALTITSNAVWWSRLGYAREMAGDNKWALSAYKKALQLNPGDANALKGKERVEVKIHNG